MLRHHADNSIYGVLSKIQNATESALPSKHNCRSQAGDGLLVLGVDIGEDSVLALEK